MSQLRASKGFYIKANNVPINTVKTAYFNRLKYRFPLILLTQTTDDEKNDCCTHHIECKDFFKFNQLFMTWSLTYIITRLNLII